MKERQGEAFDDFNELLKTNKGDHNVPEGNFKERSNNKLPALKEENEDGDIQEVNFKDRKGQNKNKPSNNFFGSNNDDGDYENEGVMVDRQGKAKKVNPNNNFFDNDN